MHARSTRPIMEYCGKEGVIAPSLMKKDCPNLQCSRSIRDCCMFDMGSPEYYEASC